MRQTMDLRILKTRKSIKSAFLELREGLPLEKIRVNRLCEIAMINKTTFYKHYQDIYALSEEIENTTILAIMNSFKNIHSLFTDPQAFISGLYTAFKAHEKLIMTLFAGRMDVLFEKVERQLVAHYPSIGLSHQKEILLSFLIKGASHVLIEAKYEEDVMLDTLSSIALKVIEVMEL